MRWRLLVLMAFAGCSPQLKDSGQVAVHNKEAAPIAAAGGQVSIDDGSNVSLPPGAIAVGSNVTVQKVAARGVFDAAGAPIASSPVAITAVGPDGSPVPQAASAMTIELAVNGGTSLALASATDDNLCVLLKDTNGSLFFWRRAAIDYDDSTKIAKIQSMSFGTYQVVYCGSDSLPGFTDATLTIGAGSGANYSVSVIVPAGLDTDLAPTKACAVAFLDQSNGTGTDTSTDAAADAATATVTSTNAASGSGSNKPITVIAAAQATYQANADVPIALPVPALQVTDGNQYVVGIGLITGTGDCPFKTGDNIADGHTVAGVVSFYAFKVTSAALVAGVTGRVGDSGPFQLAPVNVALGGPGSFAGFPDVDAPTVCMQTDTDFGHMTRLVAFSKGEISGKTAWPLNVPFVGSTTTNSLDIDVRVGQDCTSFLPAKSDPAKGLPYRVTIHDTNAAADGTYYLTPTTLSVDPTSTAAAAAASSGENGCVELAGPGGLGSQPGQNLGDLMVSLTQAKYPLYLPFLTAASDQKNGVPQYDLRITMLAAGKDCSSRSSSDASVPVSGRPLTQTIQVQF